MYKGSMVGAGAIRFAVMGYVIANAVPDKAVGMQVEVNPVILAAMLGESVEDVEEAITFLCSPDPNSRTKAEQGRRLVKIGQYDYKLVNGIKYRSIKDEETRREQNRVAQERFRRKKHTSVKGSASYERVANAGATEAELERCVTANLPEPKDDQVPFPASPEDGLPEQYQ